MIIDIDQKTLRILVKGMVPPKKLMDSKFLSLYGKSYVSKKGDRLWYWNTTIDQLSEKDLYDIISFCTK